MEKDIEVYADEAWIWWQDERSYYLSWDARFRGGFLHISKFGGEENTVEKWNDVELPKCWDWT